MLHDKLCTTNHGVNRVDTKVRNNL